MASLEDKLDYIDREIRLLREFCKRAGYSPLQIENSAAPFYKCREEARRKRWLSWMVKLGVLMGVAFTVAHCDPAYRCVLAYTKITSIKVLELWDWSSVYDLECLVENPYYQGNVLTPEDCEACEAQRAIQRVQNISQRRMSEMYLKRDQPVIIEDGMRDWNVQHNMSLSYLNEVFQTNSILKMYMGCNFASNIKVKFGNHRLLLRQFAEGEVSNFYAHWENCFKVSAKAFKEFYKRPYCLPPTVEMANNNWVIVASDFKGTIPKLLEVDSPMVTIAQLTGHLTIILRPKEVCLEMCRELKEELKAGEIFVTTDTLWDLHYIPDHAGETIAVVVGGTFD